MVKYTNEQKKQLTELIRIFFLEELELEISELKAVLLLEFFLKEIAPAVYNDAIADAGRYLRERIEDMDGVLYETEHLHR